MWVTSKRKHSQAATRHETQHNTHAENNVIMLKQRWETCNLIQFTGSQHLLEKSRNLKEKQRKLNIIMWTINSFPQQNPSKLDYNYYAQIKAK